jgi:hypothetical protein
MKTTIDASKYTAHLHPGKFEGETNGATEYFCEQMLNGDGETFDPIPLAEGPDDYTCEDSLIGTLFHINAEEAEAFNLTIGNWFLLCEDSQGFANGSVHPSRQAAEHKFNEWAV